MAHDFAFACRREIGAKNLVADVFSLMRAVRVVVRHPFSIDVIKLIKAQAKEAVQALMFIRPNIALAKRIGLRRAWRSLQTSHAFRLPKCLKHLPKFLVSIVNQACGFHANSIQPHRRATNLNLQPLIIGVKRWRRHENAATSEMDKNQHIGVKLSEQRVDGLGEVIAGNQRFHVRPDKVRPRNHGLAFGFLRRWFMPRSLENISNGSQANLNAQLPEFTQDALVAPRDILSSQTDNQCNDFLGCFRSTSRVFVLRLFGLALPPSAIGLRLHNEHNILDIMVYYSSQPKQFLSLLWSRKNSRVRNAVSQHFYLIGQQLDLTVMFGHKTVRQEHVNHPKHIKSSVNPLSVHTQSIPNKINSLREVYTFPHPYETTKSEHHTDSGYLGRSKLQTCDVRTGLRDFQTDRKMVCTTSPEKQRKEIGLNRLPFSILRAV